ncbi:HNH endonuclease [Streptomyces phage LibertyBell]|nr:HNH endonuclease [Streptomyces phage LibertyBell]
MSETIWKTVDEFPQYVVSDKGDVMHFLYNRKLRPRLKTNGHLVVEIQDVDGKYYTRTVGSLVAAAYLGAPNGRAVVHINGDLKDNDLTNLKYLTRREIQIQNHQAENAKQAKRVRVRETGQVFYSIAEAGRHYGVSPSAVSGYLTGRTKKSSAGVHFEYVYD